MNASFSPTTLPSLEHSMKTLITRALIAGAVVLSAGAARAESASVEYLVQRKPLIASLTGSAQLSFGFFSDAACTSSVGSVQLSASDPRVSFERVKRQRIKGLPGADLLRIDALIVDAPAAPYVRLEGPGVVAAKSNCQPQGGAGGTDILRLVDTSTLDQVLAISGFDTIEELTAALQAGELPTDVVCQIIGTVLGDAGIELPVDACAIGEGGPTNLLQDLLGGLGGVGGL
jgi:hypothetical protein